jgi:GNAT superfamily N-acetyltransferase
VVGDPAGGSRPAGPLEPRASSDSRALLRFAREFRQRPGPGLEVIDTPRYFIQLMPDFPIPGPNHVTWVRCRPDELEALVRDVRAVFAARGLRFTWILDPGVQPPDLGDRLRAFGIRPDPHGEQAATMMLPADKAIAAPDTPGLRIENALDSYESFEASEHVADEAFGDAPFGIPSFLDEGRRHRFENSRATPHVRVLLATVDGEPAGRASVSLFPPDGAILNGGSVRPSFRGRGIYRAMVAERMRIVREAGAAGAIVWAGDMSRPVLETLGFQTVDWRRFYLDS